MFEAFVTLCLTLGSADACRTALVPGHTAATEAECVATLGPVDLPGAQGEPWCAPRPPPTLDFEEVAPGVFAHRGEIAEPAPENRGDVSNIGFVIGADAVVVIDAGGSRRVGEEVYLAVRARTELPITALVLTHMHPDHVLGAEPLREAGAEVIGRDGLGRALADRAATYEDNFGRLIGAEGFAGTRVIAPDREITDTERIDIGGRTLVLTARPTAHTATDLTIFDSATGTLFAGDLVFDRHAPALDGSLMGWRAVLGAMRGEPAARVVPGHGGPSLPWPGGSDDLARYLGVIEADTRAALAKGLPLSEATAVIGISEAPRWRLFDLFNARNATVAYTELEWE